MPEKQPAGFRNPHHLPTKICASCGRPFVWRKKWERDWDKVLYCSDACKRVGKQAVGNTLPEPPQRKS